MLLTHKLQQMWRKCIKSIKALYIFTPKPFVWESVLDIISLLCRGLISKFINIGIFSNEVLEM